jgi:hypothetical protein
MKKWLTSLLLIAGVVYAGGAEFAKALNYRIVVPDKASAIEKAAAGELKLHLGKTFSAPVKLNGKTPAVITFFVGSSKEAAAAGFKNAAYKGEFAVFKKGDNFFFAGVDTPNGDIFKLIGECGTFHSVSYFLQKYAGVVFFMPGAQGIKYAKNPELKFTSAVDSPVPAYGVRGFQSAGKGCPKEEAMLYFRRRLGRVPAWTKSNYYYTFLNKWNKRFKDKPEMFALHEGRRVNEKYPRHFPCTSNPAVVDQVVADVVDVLKKRSYVNSIRFFCDAPVRSCECTSCRNSPAGKLVTAHDHSETVYAFFCQIANRLAKYKKGLYFHIQTKGSVYYQVPRTEKLPPNTVISVLTGHFLPVNFVQGRALCDSWRKAGARVIIYSYPRAPEMKDFPLMNPHRIAEYFKNFKGAAEGSNISEGRSKVPYSFSALNTYVQSSLMFDTALDTDRMIDRFCHLAAPAAHKELKSFYTAMEKLLEGAGFRDDPRFNCYSIERLQAPRAILGKALAKEPGNKFLKQLCADFDNFIKSINQTSPAVEKYKKAMKAHNASAAKRKLVKLSDKAVSFPFVPFKVYEDFQDAVVQLSQEKGNFKFKAVCSENDIRNLRAVCTRNHTGQLWSDDVIEVFAGKVSSARPYIHMTFNAKGFYRIQLYDVSGKITEMTGFPVKTVGNIGKNSWSVEAVIPVKALAAVTENGKIKISFCRSRTATGKKTAQLSAVQKSISGGFHSETGRFTVQFR